MAKEEDEEAFRAKLNAHLPEDVKVFCVCRCSNRFNAKNCTSNREYSYYLPSFLLTKITDLYFGSGNPRKQEQKEQKEEEKQGIKIIKTDDDQGKLFENPDAYMHKSIDHIPETHYEQLYKYRLTPEDKERVQRLFTMFLGTKKYHNYSKEVKPHQT
jgi:tRNA U38,U39,U40 pseudouridine synthase TruA